MLATHATSFWNAALVFGLLPRFILLLTLLSEFIHLIASEANEISAKENKKTIQPEHVLKALHV